MSKTQHRPKPLQTSEQESPVRQRIVSGARAHFFAHGFRIVTMDELANKLGMSKKTLYAHFRSKTELLDAVIADKFRHVDADLSKATAIDSADIAFSIQTFFTCLLTHFQEIQPPFVRDLNRSAPETFHSIQERRRALIVRYFTGILNDGRKSGVIRKDIPVTLMVEILICTVDAVVNPKKVLELELSAKHALSTILTIFFEGVASPAK